MIPVSPWRPLTRWMIGGTALGGAAPLVWQRAPLRDMAGVLFSGNLTPEAFAMYLVPGGVFLGLLCCLGAGVGAGTGGLVGMAHETIASRRAG